MTRPWGAGMRTGHDSPPSRLAFFSPYSRIACGRVSPVRTPMSRSPPRPPAASRARSPRRPWLKDLPSFPAWTDLDGGPGSSPLRGRHGERWMDLPQSAERRIAAPVTLGSRAARVPSVIEPRPDELDADRRGDVARRAHGGTLQHSVER